MSRRIKPIFVVGIIVWLTSFAMLFLAHRVIANTNRLEAYQLFLEQKEQLSYEVSFTYQASGSTKYLSPQDIYAYTDSYRYYQGTLGVEYDYNGQRTVLVTQIEGVKSYYSNIQVSHQVPPLIKGSDASIEQVFDEWFQHPIFHLLPQYQQGQSVFTYTVKDLPEEAKTYLSTRIGNRINGVLNQEGVLTLTLTYSFDSRVQSFRMTSSNLFGGINSYEESGTIRLYPKKNYMDLLSTSVDVSPDRPLSESAVNTFQVGDTFIFQKTIRWDEAALLFFEIETAGEYEFHWSRSTIYSNDPLYWRVFDLNLRQYRTRIIIDRDEIPMDDYQASIYLEPGIYFVNFASQSQSKTHSLTLRLRLEEDDRSGTVIPDSEVIDSDQTVLIRTDYPNDIDAIRLQSSHEYVLISGVLGLLVGYDAFPKEHQITYDQILFKIEPNVPFVLYLKDYEVKEQTISIRFLSKTETAVPFHEAPWISWAPTVKERIRESAGLSLQGGVDRYRISAPVFAEYFIESHSSKVRLFDATMREISPGANGFYRLLPGDYYIELYDFWDSLTRFFVGYELLDPIRQLNATPGTHRIEGHVASSTEIDIVEFTLDEWTEVSFSCPDPQRVLMVGMDNPLLEIWDICMPMGNLTKLMAPGTYRMTFPQTEGGYFYLIEMTLTPQRRED